MSKLAIAALAFALGCGSAQAADDVIRIRGAVQTIDSDSMTIASPAGDPVKIRLAADVTVLSAGDGKLADVKPDSFIGAAGMPQPDGSQKAMQVTVFAPSLRGTAEGHYPWDLGADSTMTNGVVGALTGATDKTLTVTYKGGQQTILVQDGVPVTTVEPGDKSLVKPGAKLVAFTKQVEGVSTAVILIVGRDGVTPSM